MHLGTKIVPPFKLLLKPGVPRPLLPPPVVGVVTRGEPPFAVVTVGMAVPGVLGVVVGMTLLLKKIEKLCIIFFWFY